MRQTPMPGMPIAPGDPGLFVCGSDDIAPWEREPLRVVQPIPPAPHRPGTAWLVLSICASCNVQTERYCREHNATNWWLETMATTKRPTPGS